MDERLYSRISRSGVACGLVIALATLTVATARASGDAPEISRSAGVRGGVVALWPRIIPRTATATSRELATAVQRYMVGLIRRTLPNRPIDIRPEPERVCRRAGCEAISVGVLLVRKNAGCVLIGLVSRPGQSPAALIPWLGEVQLKQRTAGFREPPESQVRVLDFAMCDQLPRQLSQKNEALITALAGIGAATPR